MPFRKQDSSVFDNFELRLNDRSQKFLRTACKWSFMIAIFGFIASGLLLFLAMFVLIFFNNISGINQFGGLPAYVLSIIYMIVALLTFIPALYLYGFSRRMAEALREKNTEDLTIAFSKLKSYFKFIGISILVIIILYVIGILFTILAGVS